jgi:hypothetical protein
MFYTPKHCCECGEKIERAERKFFSSRRFCEICASDLTKYEWTPRVIIGLGLFFGIFGIGNLLTKPDQPLNITTATPAVSVASKKNQNIQNSQAAASENVFASAQSQTAANDAAQSNIPASSALSSQKPAPAKQNLTNSRQNSAVETVYFCGAQTKKGMPCSRKVKGAGRCWQHTGEPAMLPPEKLVAGR